MKNTTLAVKVMDARLSPSGKTLEIDLELSGSHQDEHGRVVLSPKQRTTNVIKLGEGGDSPDKATKVGNSRSPMSDPRQRGAI